MYNTSGSRALWEGFRGYCGGFANNVVKEDSERASTGAVMRDAIAHKPVVGLVPTARSS